MAANIKNPEERERRIEEIGNFFKETGLPTRQIADYFSNNYYPISHKTVYQYIRLYMEKHPEDSDIIEEKIFRNTEVPYNSEKAKKRILEEAKLVLEGKTFKEISSINGISHKVVYHDITERLKRLSLEDSEFKSIYEKVIIKVKENQFHREVTDTEVSNIKKGKK